jgi:hypothetical protein
LEAVSRGYLISNPSIQAEFVPNLNENLISFGAPADNVSIFIGDKTKISVIDEVEEVKLVVNC